jgi:hypothetical protein
MDLDSNQICGLRNGHDTLCVATDSLVPGNIIPHVGVRPFHQKSTCITQTLNLYTLHPEPRTLNCIFETLILEP